MKCSRVLIECPFCFVRFLITLSTSVTIMDPDPNALSFNPTGKAGVAAAASTSSPAAASTSTRGIPTTHIPSPSHNVPASTSGVTTGITSSGGGASESLSSSSGKRSGKQGKHSKKCCKVCGKPIKTPPKSL